MNYILIYRPGEAYEDHINVEEFSTEKEMLSFINDKQEELGDEIAMHDRIVGMYYVQYKYNLQPIEKILQYKLKRA